MARLAIVLLSLRLAALPLRAWDAPTHRIITCLALDALGSQGPDWLQQPAVRAAIAFQANQPDRWRGWPALVLEHENDPEHYLDLELLEPFGLTLETIPRLRREYLRAMVLAGGRPAMPYDPRQDPARSKQWPGFLAHAVMEHYVKLQAAFNLLRILEALAEPGRAGQLAQARANVVCELGMLSHFVADAAQPLHTTRHYKGWVGDNPAGYTTDPRFHSYIDGGLRRAHQLSCAALRPHLRPGRTVCAPDPWPELLAYIRRAHEQVGRLYRLERDGELDGPAGRRFLVERLTDAAAMLAAMYRAAYASSAPSARQIADFVRYDARGAEGPAPASSAPAAPPTPKRRAQQVSGRQNAPREVASAGAGLTPRRSLRAGDGPALSANRAGLPGPGRARPGR